MRPLLVRLLFAAAAALTIDPGVAAAQDADTTALATIGGIRPDATGVAETAGPPRPATVAPVQEKTPIFTWPVAVFSMSAAADWTSTGWALSHPESREDNPTIAWAKFPPAIIAVGIAIDAIGGYAWTKSTQRHPKMRTAGFLVAAAFRSYLVVQNIRHNGPHAAR